MDSMNVVYGVWVADTTKCSVVNEWRINGIYGQHML